MNEVVSNLTYVRAGMRWNYICVLVDLFNREIIGYSAGFSKDAVLVSKALASVKINLKNIQIFHTDRGNEFKNQLIDEALKSNVHSVRKAAHMILVLLKQHSRSLRPGLFMDKLLSL